MYNWSVDEEKLKTDPEAYQLWRLEQMINFGLGSERLRRSDLLKYWPKLKIDPARQKFLRLLLDDYGNFDKKSASKDE